MEVESINLSQTAWFQIPALTLGIGQVTQQLYASVLHINVK